MSATVLSETNDVSCSIDFDALVLRATYNTKTDYGRIITIKTEINMEADTNADNANVIINMIPSHALSSCLLLMSRLVNNRLHWNCLLSYMSRHGREVKLVGMGADVETREGMPTRQEKRSFKTSQETTASPPRAAACSPACRLTVAFAVALFYLHRNVCPRSMCANVVAAMLTVTFIDALRCEYRSLLLPVSSYHVCHPHSLLRSSE